MRYQTQEITKTSDGAILVITWEWNNGWNLINSRQATYEETKLFNAGDGLPVKIK